MAISRELNGKDVELEEYARDIFDNVQFSAGLVRGDPDEEIYLRIEKEGNEEEEIFYMQGHEALAFISELATALLALDVKAHRSRSPRDEIEAGRGADPQGEETKWAGKLKMAQVKGRASQPSLPWAKHERLSP